MPLKSSFPLLHIPDNVSLSDLILSRARKYEDRIAVVDGPTGEKFTYKQLAHMVECMAASMYERGLRKGDVVFILSPNCIEILVASIALTSLGAIMSSANPLSTEDELVFYLSETKPSWLIAHAMVYNNLMIAANKANGRVKERYVVGRSKEGRPLGDLLRGGAGQPPRVHINPREDVAFILFSSGTSGRPKGVLFTHFHITSCLFSSEYPEICFKSIDGPENHVSIMPFFHVTGLFNTLALFVFGDTAIIFPRFVLEEYLQAVQDYKPKSLSVVPPIVVLLAKHPLVDKFNLESVIAINVGAAPTSQQTEMECKQRLNLKYFRQGYGMTECGPVTHFTPRGINKPGSVGLMIPNVMCMVMDVESGRELGVNEDGELWLKSPGMMKGYLNRPEATAEAITPDGFYKTGDIGHYDADGYFYIVDRLKELIKYKGFQVAPADLEALLLSHPAVADVAVIGIPDEAAGELPRAYVVKKDGAEVNDTDLEDFVAGRVAPYKRIRGGVVFLSEVPKSPSGKIMRKILRAELKNDTSQHGKAKL